jgi:hypothetical protein
MTPELAEGTAFLAAFNRLHKHRAQLPKRVRCVVVTDKTVGFPWIQKRHDRDLKGAGLEPWSAMAKYRAAAAQGKSAPAIDVMEFVLAHGNLDNDVQETIGGQGFSITNLERLVDSTFIRDQLDLETGEKYLTCTADKKWVLKIFREFVDAIARGEFEGKKFSVGKIYTVADQRAFLKKLLAKYPKPARSSKRWLVAAETDLPSGFLGPRKAKNKQLRAKTSARRKLIPSICAIRPPVGRANDIYRELRRLDVDTYRNAVSILFRVFVEFSAEEYISREGLKGVTPADSLNKKLRSIVQHLEANGVMSKKNLHSINKALADPNSLLSTVTMNSYVHNSKFYPSADDLKTSWDNFEPFLEKLWDA